MNGIFRYFKREIPASLAEVDGLCLQFRSLLMETGTLNSQARFALELLAREALSNAVRHGCYDDARKRVFFECRLGSLCITLKVTDEGPGFDWRAGLLRPADDEAAGGRGLSLFQLYASKVLYNQRGNRILLIRAIKEPTCPTTQQA